MTAPKRIQMSRQHPWRRENPDAVIVARPSRWGNPFKVGEDVRHEDPLWPYIASAIPGGSAGLTRVAPMTTELCVDLYGMWFVEQPTLMLSAIEELGGHDLACWCPLDRPCHGDWLLELVAP